MWSVDSSQGFDKVIRVNVDLNILINSGIPQVKCFTSEDPSTVVFNIGCVWLCFSRTLALSKPQCHSSHSV